MPEYRVKVSLEDHDHEQIYSLYEETLSARNRLELFRRLQCAYGRCISKMHIDSDATPVGWVFERRVPYLGCPDTYLQHAWVEVLGKESED